MGWFSNITDFVSPILGGLRDDDRNARAAADQRQSDERGSERQMAFQTSEAVSARQWSERMANTAHQRQIADLAAAGLNPILSGTGGMGANTPGTSAPSGSKAGAALQAASTTGLGAAASAMAYKRNRADLELIESQMWNTQMDTALKDKLKTKAIFEGDVAEQEAKIRKHQERGHRVEADIDSTKYGEIMRYIDRAIGTVNSAKGMFRQK